MILRTASRGFCVRGHRAPDDKKISAVVDRLPRSRESLLIVRCRPGGRTPGVMICDVDRRARLRNAPSSCGLAIKPRMPAAAPSSASRTVCCSTDRRRRRSRATSPASELVSTVTPSRSKLGGARRDRGLDHAPPAAEVNRQHGDVEFRRSFDRFRDRVRNVVQLQVEEHFCAGRAAPRARSPDPAAV